MYMSFIEIRQMKLKHILIISVDEVERTVTIQLDGEEFTMEFIDVLPWDVSFLPTDIYLKEVTLPKL